jgi:hypothetical protein
VLVHLECQVEPVCVCVCACVCVCVCVRACVCVCAAGGRQGSRVTHRHTRAHKEHGAVGRRGRERDRSYALVLGAVGY